MLKKKLKLSAKGQTNPSSIHFNLSFFKQCLRKKSTYILWKFQITNIPFAMRFLMAISFCWLTSGLFGQGNLPYEGTLKDAVTGLPIYKAHLTCGSKTFVTDREGRFYLRCGHKDTLAITHIGYENVIISPDQAASGSLHLVMFPGSNQLPEVEISDKPVGVYTPPSVHVFDFDFKGDTLIVLTYEKWKMVRRQEDASIPLYTGCHLELVDPAGKVIGRKVLPDFISKLYRDPLGQLFLIGKDGCMHIRFHENEVSLVPVEDKMFKDKIQPLNAHSSTHWFFDNYTRDFPEFAHFAQAKNADTETAIRTIRDDFTMELFRAEYKYMSGYDKLRAIRLEKQTGIDKEIFGAYMMGFQNSLFYQPLYAPAFFHTENLLIFDHHNDCLFVHDSEGKAQDSITTSYHHTRDKKFANEILQDRIDLTYYAVYRKSGRNFLRQVNLTDGTAGEQITLYHPYPEKLKVVNGSVYYIYRPVNSLQTRHLYREEIGEKVESLSSQLND